MNTLKRICCAPPVFLPVFVLSSIQPSLAADPAQTSKDHSLFVGQQVTVGIDGKYYPVVGAGSRSFIVEIDHRTREIYTNKAKDLRVTHGLKLSSSAAEITNLDVSSSSDRAAAEEMAGMQNAMAVSADGQDRADAAHGNLVRQEWLAALGGGSLGDTEQQKADKKYAAVQKADSIYMPIMINTMQATDRQETQTEDRLLATIGSPANSDETVQLMPEITSNKVQVSASGRETVKPKTGSAAASEAPAGAPGNAGTLVTSNSSPKLHRRIRDLGDGQSDRLDFAFEVSSRQPLDDAYVILTTEYINPSHPGINHRVLAQRIGHLDASPRKIKLYETGYPAGFHVKDYSINLYASGQELVTNLSPDRMDLTREEAYQYIVADYLASHKGESHPPAAVLMGPRSELKPYANSTELNKPVYLKVDHEGRVEAVSSDPAGTGAVSPIVRQSLEHFRFIPALEKGRPVDGCAKLVVADFMP